MKLVEVLKDIDFNTIVGKLDKDIKGVAHDSRDIKEGYLFICFPGLKTDGHLFVEQAIQNGAIAILAERKVDVPEGISLHLCSDCRKAMPKVAANYYERPSDSLKLVGVTGTNGKTTVTHLIKAILEEWGKKTGILGTLYARIDELEKDMGRTTPESIEIENFLNICKKHKAEYVVMEVSSHALEMGRVDELPFSAAVFTNLSQDHLDYHITMENYKNSKLKLFNMVSGNTERVAIVNADDNEVSDFIKASGKYYYTYSINNEADIQAVNLKTSLQGSRFTLVYDNKNIEINMKLIGLFSVYNALAAIAFAWKEGIPIDVIKSALEKVDGVAGRFEQVNCGQDFTLVVDYAHTPDGLHNILRTARQLAEKRLITVFGCGGDRDSTKRPVMGRIAAESSDFCIVTSDNPRSEDPNKIIDDIIPGLDAVVGSRYARIVDRKEAINHAITIANTGDLVIIAGKGHETYQLVKGEILDFDDRKVVRELLNSK